MGQLNLCVYICDASIARACYMGCVYPREGCRSVTPSPADTRG